MCEKINYGIEFAEGFRLKLLYRCINYGGSTEWRTTPPRIAGTLVMVVILFYLAIKIGKLMLGENDRKNKSI